MTRPFTMLAGILLLVVAAAHAYRLYAGLAITIGSHAVPLWVSWPGAVVAGFLGIMIFVESGRA